MLFRYQLSPLASPRRSKQLSNDLLKKLAGSFSSAIVNKVPPKRGIGGIDVPPKELALRAFSCGQIILMSRLLAMEQKNGARLRGRIRLILSEALIFFSDPAAMLSSPIRPRCW